MRGGFFGFCAVLLSTGGVTEADVLFSKTWTLQPEWLYRGDIGFRIGSATDSSTRIFEDLVVPFADAGTVFSAHQDSDYPGFVAMITNGVNDPLSFTIVNFFPMQGSLYWSGTEKGLWAQTEPPLDLVDFHGSQIDDVTVMFTKESLGAGLGPDSPSLESYEWQSCTFSIVGVPEPVSFLLLLAGALVIVRRRH